MKYLWTEDTGAGLHFWELVNQLFFDDAFVIESKGSNQGLLDALSDIDMKEDDKYYIKKRKERKELLALIGNRSVLFDFDDFEDDENESYHRNMFESDDIEGGENL